MSTVNNPTQIKSFIESLTHAQIDEGNLKNHEEYERQVTEFRKAYKIGNCYLCGMAFNQMQSSQPCIHWLLHRCRFKKKKHFPKIFEKYGYHNMASFLRWCANEETLFRNINDLEDEKSGRKIISYTIKWKNVDWTFDCTENDMHGHGNGPSSFPHYHFQMRIDGRQFINFNEYHVPLSNHDLFNLNLRNNPKVHHSFGSAGSGMQEVISVDPNLILENTVPTINQDEATFHFQTMIEAIEKPLSGDLIYDMLKEAKLSNKSFAYVAKQRLKNRANIKTIISPPDSIPDIANRTEHKPR
jgi:hypothetical protein